MRCEEKIWGRKINVEKDEHGHDMKRERMRTHAEIREEEKVSVDTKQKRMEASD